MHEAFANISVAGERLSVGMTPRLSEPATPEQGIHEHKTPSLEQQPGQLWCQNIGAPPCDESRTSLGIGASDEDRDSLRVDFGVEEDEPAVPFSDVAQAPAGEDGSENGGGLLSNPALPRVRDFIM